MSEQILSFEEWKQTANDISLEFVSNNPDIFNGYLNSDSDLSLNRHNFENLEMMADFLNKNISDGINNYLYTIDVLNVHTPGRYDSQQLALFENEKNNFSGTYSFAFTQLPTDTIYVLKYIEKRLNSIVYCGIVVE
jgi:hypothetical protein